MKIAFFHIRRRPVKDLPTETFVKLLTLILKCNNYAMGTKMVPVYANIFMGRLDGHIFRSVSLKPFSWFRFIDSDNMKWMHDHVNIEIFLQEANKCLPIIRFTAAVSNDEHMLLDAKSRAWLFKASLA